ncbi:XRN 5-3 exoribonuclease [uncultured virus]|nr:XRN 5-3 exoribonuclease [uncultured virus]
MGVPGFFAWLLKNYKKNNIIKNSLTDDVDCLYLDANCLFHPQCHKVLFNYPKIKDKEKIEKKMMKRITKFIDYLIDFVGPKNKVFISVDGVAPMAKMSQQRKRRYRSIDDGKLKDEIRKKYGKDTFEYWNNTVITPGTEFMEKLHNHLLEYISQKKNITILYSSYHTCGEGEHKILQDIKKTKEDKNYVIYGLDADLIFLSLASQKKNIYLLREADQFMNNMEKSNILDETLDDVSTPLNYVSIDNLKLCINDQLSYILDKNMKESSENLKNFDFTNDFIFICYLLGNDFLPHLPSVDIKTGGLDFLIDCYMDIFYTLNNNNSKICNLINYNGENVSVDNIFFNMFIQRLAKNEKYYFDEILPKFFASVSKKRCPTTDPYERDVWNLDNLINMNINDPIKLGKDDPDIWKFRYYEYYFNVKEYQTNFIKDMCSQYFKGLIWIAKYYFEQCCSWEWQYPYSHAPFLSDLNKYMTVKKFILDDYKFDESLPLLPCIQLLTILPPHCSNLLPESYQSLMISINSPIIDLYPKNIYLDMINKDSFWKCVPIIPFIDIDRIKDAIKNLKLNEIEKKRNLTSDNYLNLR